MRETNDDSHLAARHLHSAQVCLKFWQQNVLTSVVTLILNWEEALMQNTPRCPMCNWIKHLSLYSLFWALSSLIVVHPVPSFWFQLLHEDHEWRDRTSFYLLHEREGLVCLLGCHFPKAGVVLGTWWALPKDLLKDWMRTLFLSRTEFLEMLSNNPLWLQRDWSRARLDKQFWYCVFDLFKPSWGPRATLTL